MKIQRFRQQRGISLLEVMLSLAIIAIILVMAARYFGLASNTSKLNQATNQINEIIQGLAQWQNNEGNYAGASLQSLYTQGFITQQTGKGTGANSWGGNITLEANTNTATIAFTGIPNSACLNLRNRMGTGNCAGTTYSYTLNTQS